MQAALVWVIMRLERCFFLRVGYKPMPAQRLHMDLTIEAPGASRGALIGSDRLALRARDFSFRLLILVAEWRQR